MVTLDFANTVRRVQEDPRVSRPYTPAQIDHLQRLGADVDVRLADAGVELTMGSEPTFVALDEPTAAEWTVAADGPRKRELANNLAAALAERVREGRAGSAQPGQVVPGRDLAALADRADLAPGRGAALGRPGPARRSVRRRAGRGGGFGSGGAELARRSRPAFGLPTEQLQPCYEDPLAALADEVGRPTAHDLSWIRLRRIPHLIAELDRSATPVAWALPLAPAWWG